LIFLEKYKTHCLATGF